MVRLTDEELAPSRPNASVVLPRLTEAHLNRPTASRESPPQREELGTPVLAACGNASLPKHEPKKSPCDRGRKHLRDHSLQGALGAGRQSVTTPPWDDERGLRRAGHPSSLNWLTPRSRRVGYWESGGHTLSSISCRLQTRSVMRRSLEAGAAHKRIIEPVRRYCQSER